MKKISKILIVFLGGLFLFGMNSCKEDFLEVDHYDILDADQMFKSDEDALAEAYWLLRLYAAGWRRRWRWKRGC